MPPQVNAIDTLHTQLAIPLSPSTWLNRDHPLGNLESHMSKTNDPQGGRSLAP